MMDRRVKKQSVAGIASEKIFRKYPISILAEIGHKMDSVAGYAGSIAMRSWGLKSLGVVPNAYLCHSSPDIMWYGQTQNIHHKL